MTYQLDTNVVSEVRKKQPDPYVLAWITSIRSADIFLSVLTIGEIRIGIERLRRRDPDQAADLGQWLAGLCSAYADRIVKIDAGIAEEWALLNIPDPVPVIDGLLAATARCRGWILVTRNIADLAGTGVQLLNPFEPAA